MQNIATDDNIVVRSEVAKLLVDLCKDYNSNICVELLEILEKVTKSAPFNNKNKKKTRIVAPPSPNGKRGRADPLHRGRLPRHQRLSARPNPSFRPKNPQTAIQPRHHHLQNPRRLPREKRAQTRQRPEAR